MHKTLIGKDNYLFLQNDSSNEINSHQTNIVKHNSINLSTYDLNNYLLIVFPNKSYMLKNYLPDGYDLKYRPNFDKYKNYLKDNILDCYQILKDENDVFYKTDTHMNLNGCYIIYKHFIDKINTLFNLSIEKQNIIIEKKNVNNLSSLCKGIGDLTWETNLGDQKLEDVTDNYYTTTYFNDFYMGYIVNDNASIRFLLYSDNKLIDETKLIENKIVDWNIVSKYIVYNKINCNNKLKILIFYDSFLQSTIPLYLNMFNEIYLVKNIYSKEMIDLINPDYVFEFRVERFLF